MFSKSLNILVNFLILGLVVFTLAAPDGPLAEWRSRHSERRLTARALAAHRSELRNGDVLGLRTMEQQVVVFTDYQCPFCRAAEAEIHRFLAENPKHGIIVRHFPVESRHPFAHAAALAAICAAESERFPAMHETLMASDFPVGVDWTELAANAGVEDLIFFEECVNGGDAESRLESDKALGFAIGVRGTPTFVIGDELYVGAVTAEQLLSAGEGR